MPIYSPTGFLDITNATLRTSNVEAQNLLMTGGNIYVTSELETNIVLNLENVTNKGNITSNTIQFTNTKTSLVASSNVDVVGNVFAYKFIGSGAGLTNIPPSAITGTLSQWSDGTNGDVYIASNVGIGNVHTLTSNTLQVGGNLYVRDTDANVLTVNGNVVASYFEGDGSKLSGIVTDLQGVTDNGNVTTNVVQFSNATTGLVTTANVEVGGDVKIVGLTAGTVPYVGADKFLKDSFITTTGDTTVITSNLDVTGNIFMRGEKYIVNSESKLINDAIIGIANNNTVSTTDKGIIMQNTAGNVAIIHHGTGDAFAGQLTFGYTDDPLDTITVTNDLTKELTVNILGNVITQNNLSVGGTLSINNITAAAQHSLQAVTNVGNVTSNTVQFSNAITSLKASSNIVATGNVSAGYDTNTTSYFGRAAVGYMGQDDQASFAHVDRNTTSDYAIKQTANGSTYINTPASGHIRFTVADGLSNAEKMRITNAGNVGIGASSPGYKLDVYGTANVGALTATTVTTSGGATFNTNTLKVDAVNSRVGIGVTNPRSPLTVYNGEGVHITSTYTVNYSQYSILDFNYGGGTGVGTLSSIRLKCEAVNRDSGAGPYYDYGAQGKLIFQGKTNNLYSGGGNDQTYTDIMTIDGSTKNVGIGTVSPDYKLHVSGGVSYFPDGISTPGYHAQMVLSGGGNVTWDGSNLLWSNRIIALPIEKTEFSTLGYINIECPTTGTITHYKGDGTTGTVTCTSSGVPITEWTALWYVVTPGQSQASDQTKFILTDYRNGDWRPDSNWLLIATKNGDSQSQYGLKFMPTNSTHYTWIAPSFSDSWVNYDSTYNSAAYYKDSENRVHLRGLVKDGLVGSTRTIFTLPVGFRPVRRELFCVMTNANVAGRIDISPDGRVIPHTVNAAWVSLDNLSFKAA